MRLLMFCELGRPDDTWVDACTAYLAPELSSDAPRLTASVVDDPSGSGLIACGVGYLERRLPGPSGAGVFGHIGSMYTEVPHRRRGHGRAVLQSLLDWLWDHDAERAQLWASEFGAPLYAAEGFSSGDPLWLLRRPRRDR